MGYIIWLYLANISNRFRQLATNIFRFSLISLLVEYLLLATHQIPDYANYLGGIINDTWIVAIISFFLILLPSERFVFNALAIKKNDNFIRNSIVAKVVRLIKYLIKHDLLGMPYKQGLYQRWVTPKRLKYVYILFYLYDVYKGYSKVFIEIFYSLIAYFGFAVATWIYVRYTGTYVYYIHTINQSFGWGIAIIGFLLFKILFFPNWKTIKMVGIAIIVRVIMHKTGLVRAGQAIEDKLESYQPKVEEN